MDWSLVFNATLVVSAEKLLIDGFWSSVLVILIVTDWLEVLPAASPTLSVKLSLLEPKL